MARGFQQAGDYKAEPGANPRGNGSGCAAKSGNLENLEVLQVLRVPVWSATVPGVAVKMRGECQLPPGWHSTSGTELMACQGLKVVGCQSANGPHEVECQSANIGILALYSWEGRPNYFGTVTSGAMTDRIGTVGLRTESPEALARRFASARHAEPERKRPVPGPYCLRCERCVCCRHPPRNQFPRGRRSA